MRFRFALGLSAAVALMVTPVTTRTACAQTGEEVAAARALFAEALKDEEAGQNAQALEKFQRVQQVKDTPQVRFRIGSCLERLGKLRSARESFQAAAALGGGSKANAALVTESQERVTALTRRIPDLTLNPATPAPADAVVKVDETVVPPSAWQTPIALDPGEHAVDASAPGYEPFHATSTLSEGSHLSVAIPWRAATSSGGAGATGAGATNGNGGATGNGTTGPGGGQQPPPHGSDGSMQRTWGWISLGVGGALLATSGVFVLLRHGEISTIKDACNGGVCPRSRQSELQTAHDHAVTDGTIGLISAGAGVVAAGIGVALLLTAPSVQDSTSSAPPPAAGSLSTHLVAAGDVHGASFGWRGTF